MKLRLLLFCLGFMAGAPILFGQLAGTNALVRFHTDLGDMDVLLRQDTAPKNVANFLNYVNKPAYDNSFIHRSSPNFVIQGGGYKFVNGQTMAIPADPPVMNEFHLSNTRGTLAMAKVAGNPDSATNQWFFNESDSNASNLDTQNGGFTVFGRIINATGLTTMDTIAAVPRYNFGAPFDELPLIDYTPGNAVHNSNLVNVIWIKVVPQISALSHPSANTIHLDGIGAVNTTYKLQTSTSLATAFANLTNVTASSTGIISYNDTSAGSRKFYRLTIP